MRDIKIREDSLALDPGSATNLPIKCSICGKLIPGTEDAYSAYGARGAYHLIHKDCAVRVGLKW